MREWPTPDADVKSHSGYTMTAHDRLEKPRRHVETLARGSEAAEVRAWQIAESPCMRGSACPLLGSGSSRISSYRRPRGRTAARRGRPRQRGGIGGDMGSARGSDRRGCTRSHRTQGQARSCRGMVRHRRASANLIVELLIGDLPRPRGCRHRARSARADRMRMPTESWPGSAFLASADWSVSPPSVTGRGHRAGAEGWCAWRSRHFGRAPGPGRGMSRPTC